MIFIIGNIWFYRLVVAALVKINHKHLNITNYVLCLTAQGMEMFLK